MTERSIIIFWKTNNDNVISDMEPGDSKKCKIYLSNLTHNNLCNCINNIDNCESKKIIVLLHKNDPNNFNNAHKNIIEEKIKRNDKHIKVYLFGGGPNNGHRIYYHIELNPKGILENDDIAAEALDNSNSEKKLKGIHFDFVWEWYWSKLDLEEQKKKLIDLWLPVAIDAQGMREVNEGRINDYLNEILDQYQDDKKIFEAMKDNLEQIISTLVSQGNKNTDILPKLPFKFEGEKLLDYLKKIRNNPKKDEEILVWLKKSIQVLDKAINQPT